MISDALPSTVVVEERFGEPRDFSLFPEEKALLTTAVEQRRREFATGRACARAALGRLGHPPRPLLPDDRGAPIWPRGILGSITHCAGYCCAAVAESGAVQAIGIDAEPHEPLADGILEVVARLEERRELAALASADPTIRWDRLLFTCKEATYKAWYPRTRQWLDFDEASMTLEPATRSFSARLLRPAMELDGDPAYELQGRWVIGRGLVIAAIAAQRR